MGDALPYGMATNDNVDVFDMSDDDFDGELKEGDDPECSTIHISKSKKADLHLPRKYTLIIKVMGRSVGLVT